MDATSQPEWIGPARDPHSPKKHLHGRAAADSPGSLCRECIINKDVSVVGALVSGTSSVRVPT